MKLLVVNHKEVRQLLDMESCIDVVTTALRSLAEGDALQPLRSAIVLANGKGLLGLMPAYLGNIDAHAVKAVSIFPGNHGSEYDAHQGVVVLYEGDHGCPIAVMDGSEITAIRTAAASAVATRLLAREDSSRLAMIGSGIQARTHLEAMRCIRPIASATVWSKTPERAEAFASRVNSETGIPVVVADTARAAVGDADIICTTTSARQPIIEGSWLPQGCHINAVGACVAAAREFDGASMARSRLFTDRLESLLNEAGDFLLARQEGLVGDGDIQGEIGDLLIGKIEGRKNPEEITFFKSLGIGVEDLAAAQFIYDQAKERGVGQFLEFSEAPDADD